jgi:hypothetical protein
MEWRTGDLINVCKELDADGVVFTANSVICNKNGIRQLVVGSGAALRVKQYFPDSLPSALANVVAPGDTFGVTPDYHFAGVTFKRANKPDSPFYVFALQVKRHFANDGDLQLAIESLTQLAAWCQDNPDVKLVLNCPLIGLGGFASRAEEIKGVVEGILRNTNVVVTIL